MEPKEIRPKGQLNQKGKLAKKGKEA